MNGTLICQYNPTMEQGNKAPWEQTNILFVALWKDGNVLLIQEPRAYCVWRQLIKTALRL